MRCRAAPRPGSANSLSQPTSAWPVGTPRHDLPSALTPFHAHTRTHARDDHRSRGARIVGAQGRRSDQARLAGEHGDLRPIVETGLAEDVGEVRLPDLEHLDVSVGVYTALPVWRIIRTDRSVFLSVFGHAVEGHQSEVHRLDAGLLHAGFARQLADHWESARRVL